MDPSPLPPQLVSALAHRYRVERRLGDGGTAVVYLATDLKHDRKVALKVLRPELAALVGAERFVAEIRTTANLQHPHILPLFDSGEVEGVPFYVMPYVEGESLRERLETAGPLSLEEAASILRDVASALQYAHGQGVIHRDIKPDNVLLSTGGALVADFGIALALSEVRPERRTAAGVSLGTPGYMAPEQIDGGQPADARTDVYALGGLLYEMLTGHAPFAADSLQAMLAKALTEEVPSVRTQRPQVPVSVDAAVRRALSRDPADRFDTVESLTRAVRSLDPGSTAVRRRIWPWAVATSVAVLAAGVWGARALQRASARASLPEIAGLVQEGRYGDAFRLAEEAERWIPEDSSLHALLIASSSILEVESEPAGARVYLQPFDPSSERIAEEEFVGVTPLAGLRLPRVDHRVVARLDGFVTAETMVSSEFGREWLGEEAGRTIPLQLELSRESDTPSGMLRVPGGDYQLSSPDAPAQETVPLEPFFIHRYEVTNEAFAEFVREGGYADDALWPEISDRSLLVDRTGLPGPREWSRQRYPQGEERLPVTGVTWWEAQAFCRLQGGRLPTVFEWEKTARAGLISRYGVIMPWGVQVAATAGARRANFNSDGPVEVDRYPFGVSPFGAYGMAGNVSEWTSNSYGGGRAVTGGSWAGPSYLYTEYAAESPDFASSSLGFRCVIFEGEGDQGGAGIDLDLEPPSYTPVGRSEYRAMLDFYRYDAVPPRARTTDEVATADWIRERVWIDGPSGDSVLVYFWAPRSSAPPYQTLVFVPGSSVFFDEALPDDVEVTIGPLVQGGRAVLATVMYGMTERSAPGGAAFPDPPSVGFRDLMVRHATELRLAMDYAETREDVDSEAFAYVGTSWGAGSRLAFAAVDDRFKAVVLVGAGIDERMKPTLPEADNVNFAPYIAAPTLMLNGTNDEEHPWIHRARPLWELLSEPKELELVDGAGHLPPLEARIPAMNDFLDRTLGPVR